ncbi:hypothetical protein B0T18DRAFT_425345 [Schizothecium vesticola]|uniref:Zn(2)-C6 fungal-type domain-containing protein n=1 Tax=Schizothecium vesticola TaxID=314040 RepID=A0AA40FCF3_9PEZI|nr:hypothetical protein B0T18DRAFT_425345 [Schizothecium vesticola]
MPRSGSRTTSGKRSRSGCITCKIRRVKCDESRPSCTRCLASGRTCDGYASSTTAPQSRRALAHAVRLLHVAGPASRVLGEPVAADDAACFDFFRHCTSSMTGSVLPAPFWERLVLQMAWGEKAVWRVVVALGALHRRWEYSNSRTAAAAAARQREGPDAIVRFTKQAASHYYGAISLAKEIHAPETLAVLSAALAAAAPLAGLWSETQVHINAGLRLIHGAAPHTIPRGLAETLDRLDLQAMFFEDVRAPYVYMSGADHSHLANAPRSAVPWSGTAFISLDDAALVIFRLMRFFMLAAAAAEQGALDLAGLEAAVARSSADAARWEAALSAFLVSRPSRVPEGEERMVLVMRLYHTTLQQLLTAGIVGSETRWDRCLGLFVRGVELAEEVARTTPSAMPFFMSLEPGVATPLFLTAVRCRHPVVRRRALGLLGRMNRQEGIWNCGAAGRVAEQCVLVEEEGLEVGLPLRMEEGELRRLMEGWEGVGVVDGEGWAEVWPGGWPNVPESKRLLQTSLLVDVDKSVIELSIYVTGEDGMGTAARTVSIDI